MPFLRPGFRFNAPSLGKSAFVIEAALLAPRDPVPGKKVNRFAFLVRDYKLRGFGIPLLGLLQQWLLVYALIVCITFLNPVKKAAV